MSFHDVMAFRGRWRDYQQNILESLDSHLGDERLHVVAAPGSGKTVLGLEVVRRLARPTLVLAPTVAIRDQWIDTLRSLFLEDEGRRPAWISTSLNAPAELRVVTYQALHAAMRDTVAAGEADADIAAPHGGDLAARLQSNGPLTLVLDEAHHLRREWWRALTRLQQLLDAPRIVSLTATPPYDVPHAEWVNYEALCGEIDAEISIPELVRNGDLCPHQDYLHFSQPIASEEALVAGYQAALFDFVVALHADEAFLEIVRSHAWLADAAACEADILEKPELLSAMLVFLGFAGARAPRAALDLLGVRAAELPEMSLGWLEILLEAMLVSRKNEFSDPTARLEATRDALRAIGAIQSGHVALTRDETFFAALAGSTAKIRSVTEIARVEAHSLGAELRMVVLADHVLADAMPKRPGEECRSAKLGVVPLFEALRREDLPGARLGILTGSLVVIPAAAAAALEAEAKACGLGADAVMTAKLEHDDRFVAVALAGDAGQRLVRLVTRLFDAGEVNLLVGTQALLGEGWDAPTANSLVLASYAGSYMLSNQMRGRAIRTDPARPDKAANIWHLATLLPENAGAALARRFRWSARLDPGDSIGVDLGPDMERLKRRFRAFDGVTRHGWPPHIESGLARLDLAGRDWSPAGITALNREMLACAGRRDQLRLRWQAALGEASAHARTRPVLRPTYAPRLVPFADTLLYLAITGLLGGAASAANAIRGHGAAGVPWLLLLFLGLTIFYALPKLGRAAYLLVRNGSLEGCLEQVGRTVVEGLGYSGVLQASPDFVSVRAGRDLLGRCLIEVEGAGRRDESAILAALEEVLGPVANPRYLIVREARLGRWLRIDYHPVPSAIGRNKADAEHYAELWNRNVGRGRLVFARNGDGRHVLLRARARSLAAGFERFVDRLSAWR